MLLLGTILGLVIVTGDMTPFVALLGGPGTQPTPLAGVVTLTWKIALSGIVCLLGLLVAAPLRTAVTGKLEKQEVQVNLRTLVARACYALILLAVFFAVLLIWDVQIALPLAVITGVLTFALRDLIKDVIAGVYILAEHQFQLGDQITISSYTGTVTHINLRATSLRLVTGEAMIVPNGHFLDENVRNNTRYDDRRATITALLALADYDAATTPLALTRTVKNTAIVSGTEEPSITLSAVTGRVDVEGHQPGDGGNSSQAVVRLSVRFQVESRPIDVLAGFPDAVPGGRQRGG